MIYYIKKLGHQEMGSITPESPKPSRGRYMYISKNQEVLKFFPPLSRTVKNDSSLLPIIPLYGDKIEKVYCNYIYHNDKYHGSTSNRPRNEYRIYLNNILDLNEFFFTKEDIVVFRKGYINVENEGLEGELKQEVYFLEYVKETETSLYRFLESLLNKSEIIGGHYIYDGYIDKIENKVSEILDNYMQVKASVDSSVTTKAKISGENIAELFNATSFRDFVMTGYNELCAVTKTVIRCNSFMNLEAAHIKPRSHGGQYIPSNGIALSRDIHWAFDKGFFTIKDDLSITVHESIESEFLRSYEGQKILIPTNDFFKPDKNSLAYHRENVYGLFLTSGRL